MKDYSNHSSEFNIQNYYLDGILMEHISAFVTFEIFIVLISLLIMSSSRLAIYRIIKVEAEKVKYDFTFIILSISDIGLGLFSVPMVGISWYYARILQNMPYIASIAVDRSIVVKLSPKYKNLLTPNILKFMAIFLFLVSVIISSIFTIPIHNAQSRRYITSWVYSITYFFVTIAGTLCTVVVILTYLCILYFSFRRPDLKILRKNYSKNYNWKRLTNTISCVCISRLICVIRILFFRILKLNGCIPNKLSADIDPWLAILAYCQCFCNALIIIKNKKKRNIFKQTDKGKI